MSQLLLAAATTAAPAAAGHAPAATTLAVPTAAAAHPLATGGVPLVQNIVQPTPVPVLVQSPIALHAPWLTHGLAGIFMISAVGLVLLLAIQTTKQEGLSGSIGGRVESAYRGRLGAEEQLKRITGIVAVVFVITAFVLSLTGI